MTPPYFRTSAHLLVCQHVNCRTRGSETLYRALWNALDRERLAYYRGGGSVRLTESGCLGACSYGPVMCVYRQRPAEGEQGGLEEAWYAGVTFPLALRVARAAHEGAALPDEGNYGP